MIGTERLRLREWHQADIPEHDAMCRDPVFMQYLGPPLAMAESSGRADRQRANLAAYGSCFWVVEQRADDRFIGYCGIQPGPPATPIAGLPEIGWGIAPDRWRLGFAYEAAMACLAWAWTERDWPSVFAITVTANHASRGLMERIGMTRVADGDFDHPAAAEDDPLRRHVLYRIDRP